METQARRQGFRQDIHNAPLDLDSIEALHGPLEQPLRRIDNANSCERLACCAVKRSNELLPRRLDLADDAFALELAECEADFAGSPRTSRRLFDFGPVDAQIAAARGEEAEALAAYRLAVLRATEEVEN